MLRHLQLLTHEPCQSGVLLNKPLLFLVAFIFFWEGGFAQDNKTFEINISQIKYVDAETEQITYLDESSILKVLKLSRNYNHINIRLPFDSDIQYSYKVSGQAGFIDWEQTSNEIHLLGLSRGDHELSIRGEKNGVISSNLLQYSIYVSSPFYLSWWFISLVILVVVSVFYMFLVLEAKLLKERKDRNLEVSNLEAKAYRAQMNPHFIFNALNGMQTAMILGGEKEFNKYITSFSKLIRNTIEMSSVDRISVADEMTYITNYIDLQGHRLEKNIDLQFNIDPIIDQNEEY